LSTIRPSSAACAAIARIWALPGSVASTFSSDSTALSNCFSCT
jgi:predicted metallopeptidase